MSDHHADDNDIVGSSIADQRDRSAVEEYWTEERRAAAIPVPLPEYTGPAVEPRSAPAPRGQAGHTPAGGHGGTAEGEGEAEGDAGPVLNPLAYPYRTCGKLFFTQNGGNFAGSAALVAPNVLLTAGHCVFGGGNWSTNVAFFPSYGSRAATDPAFKFTYHTVAAFTAWTQNSNWAFDYGFVWFDAAPGNQVGWLGLLWNAQTAGRVWEAVGYPATPNPPYNGQVMDSAVGTVAAGDVSGTIGLTNDNMQHGSSGGPWITDFNGSPRQYANGLQSHHIHDGDTVELGPYFTPDVKRLFDWISDPAHRAAPAQGERSDEKAAV